MSYKLFIDDIRDAPAEDWIVARSSREANDIINENGCPLVISFDHDLGGDDIAMRVVNHLINKSLNDDDFFPEDFIFFVHSSNPVGAENISESLKNFITRYLDRPYTHMPIRVINGEQETYLGDKTETKEKNEGKL